MQGLRSFWAAAVATGCLLGSQADAATVLTTWTGLVYSGADTQNVFGGADVVGDRFVATFVTNTDLPGALTEQSVDRTGTYGGTLAGAPSPVSATFSLFHGDDLVRKLEFSGAQYGSDYKSLWRGAGDPAFFETRASNDDGSMVLDLMIVQTDRFAPTMLTDPDYAAPFFWDVSALGYLGDRTIGNRGTLTFDASTPGAAFGLVAQTVKVEVADGIPEPATWLLMLSGFGLLGARVRRRRALASVPGRLTGGSPALAGALLRRLDWTERG